MEVGALKSLAGGVDQMALGALDLEDLGERKRAERREREECETIVIPLLPWRHLRQVR